MKTTLPFRIFFIAAVFSTLAVQAQPGQNDHSQSDRKAYAVTDSVPNGTKWNFLRSIDLPTGTYSGVLLRLLSGADTLPVNSLCNGVAAIAHDKRNKRLYFTPMLIDRLSYVDLRTMRIHTVTNNFAGTGPKKPDQSNIITRMTIGDNDFGYALTNDGKQLIRFSTRHNNHITNLGSLVDAPGNEVSVHSACESYGGDIVADDEGNLYLVTIRNSVFKIDIRTRLARYKGAISGLPESFTTNGMAVNERNNRIVIVSSVDPSDLFSLNVHSLRARELNAPNPKLTADLANSGILTHRDRHDDDDEDHEGDPYMLVNREEEAGTVTVQLFPNPVTANKFSVEIRNAETGSYTIEVIGVNGKTVISKTVNTGGKISLMNIQLPGSTARGMYVVRVTDKNSRIIFSGKIIVQ